MLTLTACWGEGNRGKWNGGKNERFFFPSFGSLIALLNPFSNGMRFYEVLMKSSQYQPPPPLLMNFYNPFFL